MHVPSACRSGAGASFSWLLCTRIRGAYCLPTTAAVPQNKRAPSRPRAGSTGRKGCAAWAGPSMRSPRSRAARPWACPRHRRSGYRTGPSSPPTFEMRSACRAFAPAGPCPQNGSSKPACAGGWWATPSACRWRRGSAGACATPAPSRCTACAPSAARAERGPLPPGMLARVRTAPRFRSGHAGSVAPIWLDFCAGRASHCRRAPRRAFWTEPSAPLCASPRASSIRSRPIWTAPWWKTEPLLEHHRAVAVHQHAVFEVPAHGAPEHAALHVSTLADQIADRILVCGADHVLFDDRPLVERLGRVVRGGADQLHAALGRLMIRLAAGEGGQEGVMDVDDTVAKALNEARAQDLHVTRQHHQIDALAL